MVSPCSTRVKYTPPNTYCEYNIHLCFLLPFLGEMKQRENTYNSYIFTVDQAFINFNTFVFSAFILQPLA